jgi:hypothetical protein
MRSVSAKRGNAGSLLNRRIDCAGYQEAGGSAQTLLSALPREGGLADDSVVINQIRTDGRSFLVPHAGAYFTTGQMFTTPDPAVVVNIGPWQGDHLFG